MSLLEIFHSIFHLFTSSHILLRKNLLESISKANITQISEKMIYSVEEIPLKIVQCYDWDEGEILLLLDESILTDATSLQDYISTDATSLHKWFSFICFVDLAGSHDFLFHFKLVFMGCKLDTNIFI